MRMRASDEAEVEQPEYPILANEQSLWISWHQDADEAAYNKIVLHYLSYARALAAQVYRRRTVDEFEYEEYLQFATLGLLDAVKKFDPARGVLFNIYAKHWIVGAVLAGLDKLSERLQQAGMRRRIATERLDSIRASLGESERPEDILRALTEIGVGLALGFMLEGTGMIAGDDAALPDNAYSRLELRQLQQQISLYIGQLTPREQDVIRRHYFQGRAFNDIAADLGLSGARVSQLHHQGLERLRELIRKDGKCDLLL